MSVIIWALSYFPRNEETEARARTEFVAETAAAQSITLAESAKLLETAESAENPTAAQEELIGALANKVGGAWMEDSYIGRFGKFCQPIFAPCGFDWRITAGVIGAFPARELIVSTLGITYSLGGDVDEESEGLYESMEKSTHADGTPVFTIPVIIGIMVFFALCGQCLAEIVVIARESSWKWAGIAWAQMTFLAWLGAVLCYQIGSLF
jgi:ferrous iron transport protein B